MYRLALLAFFSGVLSQFQFDGPCNVKTEQVVADLDITRMLGVWYQRDRIPNPAQRGTCSYNLLTLLTPTFGYLFYSEMLNNEPAVTYAVVSRDPNQPEKIVVSNDDGLDYDTYVLATNYDDYALVLSCINIPNNKRLVLSWTLSRDPNYTGNEQAANDLFAALVKNPDISNLAGWEIVSHNNCKNVRSEQSFSEIINRSMFNSQH